MSIRCVRAKLHGPKLDSCAWHANSQNSSNTHPTDLPPSAPCPPSPALPQISPRDLSQFLGQNPIKFPTFTMIKQQLNGQSEIPHDIVS